MDLIQQVIVTDSVIVCVCVGLEVEDSRGRTCRRKHEKGWGIGITWGPKWPGQVYSVGHLYQVYPARQMESDKYSH